MTARFDLIPSKHDIPLGRLFDGKDDRTDRQVEFQEIVDLEAVTPLFKFPASVVIAQMGGNPWSAVKME